MAPTRPRVPLAAALVTSTVLTFVALVLRVSIELPDGAPLPDRLLPVLIAGAAVCSAGLTLRRMPSIAWLAAAGAAGVAAVEIVGVARALDALAGAADRSALLALMAATLLASFAVALGYAAHSRAPSGRAVVQRAVVAAGVIGLLVSVASVILALVAGPVATAVAGGVVDPNVPPIRLAARLTLVLSALGVIVGIARDLTGPFGRAITRRRGLRDGGAADRPSFLSLLGDELLPLRSGEPRRAAESERARLAADLHALVLPDLRRAAASAEASGAAPDVAADVRRSLEGIEQVMNERQSIVLEEFGLVAALEWLAERTEERSPLRVELELEGDRVDDGSAVPPDVRRVVFRVALLALDNVVRHSGASAARVSLSVAPGAVRLSVIDDGRGRADEPAPRGGRGLVDMRNDAAAVNAALSINRLEDGTRIELAWPASGARESPPVRGRSRSAWRAH